LNRLCRFGALRAQFQQRAVLINRPFAHSVRIVGHKGRFAIVTNVEAGCGGRVDVAAWLSRRRTASMRTVKSRGPDTPTLVSNR
jgi:hypothetical protein